MGEIYIGYEQLMNEFLGASIEDKLDNIAVSLSKEVKYIGNEPQYSFDTIAQFLEQWKTVGIDPTDTDLDELAEIQAFNIANNPAQYLSCEAMGASTAREMNGIAYSQGEEVKWFKGIPTYSKETWDEFLGIKKGAI